jgi:hypothetical protein
MNLDKLNRWLTFAGNIAIVLGLIALTIEINENTTAVRAQELGALQEQIQARQLASLNGDFSEVYAKGLYKPAELSVSDLLRLVPFLSHWLSNMQRTHHAYVDGVIREVDYQAQLLSAPIWFGTELGQVVWAEIKADYAHDPEFVAAIDEALRTSPVVPDDDWYITLQRRLRGGPDHEPAEEEILARK